MLIGTKVTIGPFVPEDYAAMYCWANDVVAARLDGTFRPVNLSDVVHQCDSAGKDPSRVMFAIRKRAETAIIGYLHIQNINGIHRSAELGIRIGHDKNRGNGYGTEALTLALDYCWRHLNLNRVGLIVFRNNPRAIAAYKAVGFRVEGRLKKFFFIDGAWVEVLVMAALRPSRQKRNAGALTRNEISSADHTPKPPTLRLSDSTMAFVQLFDMKSAPPHRISLSSPDIQAEDIELVTRVLRSNWLSIGPFVKELERDFADYIGTKYAVAVTNGTSGLHLCIRAAGIAEGDEVITTPFSFIASANCMLYERATPVFVDIDEASLNIDPALVARAVTGRTRALLPVHIFGQPCAMDELQAICRDRNSR